MGLEKAIASGQEHRKPYHGAKAVCFNCRNHGTCDYCKGNRLHSTRKRKAAADARQDEYEAYLCGGEDSAADAFYGSRLGAKARAGDRRSRADHRPFSFRRTCRSGAEDEVLTSRLSRGS